MFTRDFLYLDHPFTAAYAVVSSDSFPHLVSVDGEAGEILLARVGIRLAGVPLYKRVRLEVGTPYVVQRGAQAVLPIRWRPSGGPPLFPDMSGDLTLQPFGTDRTQLTLSANYRPPGGRLGVMVDRAVLHLLADATVREFALRLAAAIDSALTTAA